MITSFTIEPDYAGGFSFAWEVDPTLSDSGPWVSIVQRADTEEGPWEDISPALTGLYAWSDTGKLVIAKDPVLYFRVVMTTGSGSTYTSRVIQPYGQLGRREFLIVRNMRRQELLQMRQMTGVPGCYYSKAIFGPKCEACTDFVNGDSFSTDCDDCFGTGKTPGYHGPYCCWFKPSVSQRDKGMKNNRDVSENYGFSFRMLGTPPLKKDDIVVDSTQGKAYYIGVVQSAAELRRVPIVQVVEAREIPTSSPLYKLSQR